LMDTENRIMYDAIRGTWKVLHNGKDAGKEFKTSSEAFAHLQGLLKPPPKP
jgi:hypothetical protein